MRFRETAPDSELRKSLFDALPFFQWFTNGHFQNSEANFRTFLVRNTQVLFLLLWSTYFIRTLAFTYISGKCQMGKTNIVSNTIRGRSLTTLTKFCPLLTIYSRLTLLR